MIVSSEFIHAFLEIAQIRTLTKKSFFVKEHQVMKEIGVVLEGCLFGYIEDGQLERHVSEL